MASKSGGNVTTPIRKGLEFLCQTFGAEIDPWERRAYERTLKDVPDSVLVEAAQLLVDEAAGGRKFYPMPKAPDWKGACAKVISARRRKAFELNLGQCPHPHQLEAFIDGAGVERMRKCACWDVAKKAQEAIGQPLALAPSREDAAEDQI